MKFFSLCSKNSILTRFVQRLHVHSSSVHGSENALALSSHSAYALVFTKLLSGLPASFFNAWDLSLVC